MRDDASSSSASVTSVRVTGSPDVPDTSSVSSSSAMASSNGTSVNVPVPLAAFAEIVIAKSGTVWKSTARAWPLPVTATVTVVAACRAARFSEAVTFTGVGPAPSATRLGNADRSIPVDSASSSAIATVADVTSSTDVPDTISVSLLPATESSSGSSVNVPVPLVSPAPITISKSDTGA